MLPEHGALNRGFYLCKYLKKNGLDPIVFTGSHPHNTKLQLIKGKEKNQVYQEDPFKWVLIKTRDYEGSKKSRVLSMFEFYWNTIIASKRFEKPDAIIGSSAHPLAALLACKLGKKYGCKRIVEVRDLWPESIVNYGILSRKNPIIKFLYLFEKYLYTHADSIVFTMENAWQYIEDRGLSKCIQRKNVYYLNNGVDLEEFNKNLREYHLDDADLDDDNSFKIVYVGSIRKANSIGVLLDAAKAIKNPKVRLLFWGDGDELDILRTRIKEEGISNLILKGRVSKKYIPSIITRADINYMHGGNTPIMKYGLSANKLFDYAAAGKPILTDFKAGHNPADVYQAGITIDHPTPMRIASIIDEIVNMDAVEYNQYCQNALRLANDYSYQSLAKKMIQIIESCDKKGK